jgi:hypothetical protein
MVRLEAASRRRAVGIRFARWVAAHQEDPWALSLFDFAEKRPLKYVYDGEIQGILDLFEGHLAETSSALSAQARELSHAIHSLVSRGPSWGREHLPSLSSPADYGEFEGIWFPEYQRYTEHAFNHLINLPLGVLERVRNKQYCNLTLANRVSLLPQFGFAALGNGFRGPVRNAISHGSTEYGIADIRFVDRSGTDELTPGEFLRLFDQIVATSNAIAASIMLFILRNSAHIGADAIPLGATLMALRGASSYRGLSVERLIRTEILQGKSQLGIVCATRVPSRTLQTFDALHLAARVQDFAGPDFDRIAITFDTGHSVSGSIFLDAKRLAQARQNDERLEALGEVTETSLLWHDSSNLRRRISTSRLALRLSFAHAGVEARKRWHETGSTPLRFRYAIRDRRNTSAGSLRRVEAIVVLNAGEDPSESDLYRIARQAIRRIRRRPIRSVDIGGSGLPLRRPRYVWVKLFREDAVLRDLANPGPDNPNLLLKAEWTSLRYRTRPVFVRFPTTASRGYRFEYPVRTVQENLALIQQARAGAV